MWGGEHTRRPLRTQTFKTYNSRPRNGGESAILCKNTLHMELQLTSPCVGELVVRIEWKQLAELKLTFLMEWVADSSPTSIMCRASLIVKGRYALPRGIYALDSVRRPTSQTASSSYMALPLQHIIVPSNREAPGTGALLRPDVLWLLLPTPPALPLSLQLLFPSARRCPDRISNLSLPSPAKTVLLGLPYCPGESIRVVPS